MKKILFVIHSMNLGGTEKAFLGTLSQYTPKLGYDVYCALLEKKGELLSYLPEYVHVSEIKEYSENKDIINRPLLNSIKDAIQRKDFFLALELTFCYPFCKLFHSDYFLLKSIFKQINPFPGEFDIAVAYSSFSFPALYVAKKVNAKEKWLWVHYDVSKNGGINTYFANIIYPLYNVINIVSKEAKKTFEQKFPKFAGITRLCYNVVPIDQIKFLADAYETPVFNGDCLNLCTIGRISKEKGQDLALCALSQLKLKGVNIRWVFIGGGSSFFDYCKSLSNELGLEDSIIFTGPLLNPYPYLKNCDIYVQPSLNEGYCISIAEARIFNKPIVSTNFAGAYEQLCEYEPPHELLCPQAKDLADGILKISSLL